MTSTSEREPFAVVSDISQEEYDQRTSEGAADTFCSMNLGFLRVHTISQNGENRPETDETGRVLDKTGQVTTLRVLAGEKIALILMQFNDHLAKNRGEAVPTPSEESISQ